MTGLGIFDYISDYIGKIMFLVGAILLIVGALTLNRFGTLLSAGSVFGGILLVVFGLFVQLGFLSGNLRSLSGVGTILICLSIVLGAFSIAVVEFVQITGVQVVADIFRGIVHWGVTFTSDRPYIWLSVLCLQFGIGFFIAGVALKIINAIRP